MLEATVVCESSSVTFQFEPKGKLRVRERDDVAWASVKGRGLDFEVCSRTRTQRRWFTGRPYIRTKQAMTLECHFRGRFFVHVQPIFTSESGGFTPDGSGVLLDVGSRHLIVASASVARPTGQSSLSYLRRFCMPE